MDQSPTNIVKAPHIVGGATSNLLADSCTNILIRFICQLNHTILKHVLLNKLQIMAYKQIRLYNMVSQHPANCFESQCDL